MNGATLVKLADAMLDGRATAAQVDEWLAGQGVYDERPITALSITDPTSKGESRREMLRAQTDELGFPPAEADAAQWPLEAPILAHPFQRDEHGVHVYAQDGCPWVWPHDLPPNVDENHTPDIADFDASGRPNEAMADQMEADEEAEFFRHRVPVVAAEPWDADRGYAIFDDWRASDAALEREYARDRSYEVEVYVRDAHGYIVLNEDGSRQTTVETVESVGLVWAEYRRREWAQANGRYYLPWRWHRKWFAAEMRAIRRRERARQQRRAIIELVSKLGGDPRDPKVAAWIRERGYTAALRALEARAYARLMAERG